MDVYRNDRQDRLGLVYTLTCPNIPITDYACFHDKTVVSVATGGQHCLFLTDDHKVYACGSNKYGQLGLGDVSTLDEESSAVVEPELVQSLLGTEIIAISCGLNHSAALTSSGLVYTWGNSEQGQCGTGERSNTIPTPQLLGIRSPSQTCIHGVEEPEQHVRFKQISCGDQHMVALSEDGEVWTWGSGLQLGIINLEGSLDPVRLDFLVGRNVLMVSAGGQHTLALMDRSVLTRVDSTESGGEECGGASRIRSSSLCTKCTKNVYRFSMTESLSVTDHDHKCPLGLDLQEVVVQESSASFLEMNNGERSLDPSVERRVNNEQTDQMRDSDNAVLEASTYLMSLPDAISLKNIHLGNNETVLNSEAGGEASKRNEDPSVSECGQNMVSSQSTTNANSLPPIFNQDKANVRTSVPEKEELAQSEKELHIDDIYGRRTESTLSSLGTPHPEVSEVSANESSTPHSLSDASATSRRHLFASEKDAKDFLSKRLSDHESLDKVTPGEENVEDSPPGVDGVKDDIGGLMNSVASLSGQMKSISSKMFKSSIGMFGLVSGNSVEMETSMSASQSAESLLSPTEESSPLPGKAEREKSPEENSSLESSPQLPRSELVSSVFDNTQVFDNAQARGDESVQGPTSNDVSTTKRKSNLRYKRSTAHQATPELSSSYEPQWTIHTEVWSWGHGVKGQLGHSDRLDRPQPCLIQSLIGHQVIKVSAGGQHSLAVTATGQAYAWGDNSSHQLAGNEPLFSAPRKVKLLSSMNIWDVSAGQTASLFIADGMGFQPDLFYCGSENRSNTETSAFRFAAVKKVGWLKQVHAGGDISACIVDKNITGHLATLHEFAATERCFYQQIYRFLHEVLLPFLNSDELLSLQNLHSLVPALKKMIGDFTLLEDKVGLNVCELVKVLQTSSLLSNTSLVGDSLAFVSVFHNYSKSFGDVLALGGFEQLNKVLSTFLEKKLINISDLAESSKVERSSNVVVVFRRLLQIPLRRLKDYERLTSKLAVGSSESSLLLHVSELWEQLKQTAKLDHTAADNTRLFWENCTPKFVKDFRRPGRRLLRESKNHPLTLQSSNSFSFHWFLLFNDIFVHMRFSVHQIFPLSTLWTDSLQDGENTKYAFKMIFPETHRVLCAADSGQKAEWLAAINMAVDAVLNDNPLSHMRSDVGAAHAPPLSRHASYTFTKTYEVMAEYKGMWYNGQMHGEGQLSWSDGRVYVGKFKQGCQHGYGVLTLPKPDAPTEIREGNWRDGQLHGLGKLKFSNGDTYEGHFALGQRQGHGVYRQGLITSPVASLYIGEWANDKRNGYGVMDDLILDINSFALKNKPPSDHIYGSGEKYMGMWQDDARHGNGILVTMDGMYLEGNFVQNKMTGHGLMWTDDNTCYDGEFYAGTQLYGKGAMTLPSGHTIDGHFSGSWNEGIKVNGTVKCPSATNYEKHSPTGSHSIRPVKYGHWSVPSDRKWEDLFINCQSSLGCRGNIVPDSSKAWEAVAVKVSSGRKTLRASKNSKERHSLLQLEHLEKIPPHKTGTLTTEYFLEIKDYLIMAFDSPFHPLGKLMESLVNVYRATYMGVGAHPKLLYHAVCEVQSFVKRLFAIVRILFPDLPQGGEPVHIRKSHADEEDEGDIVAAGSLLHPILLPKIYPPLFTLYALYNEWDDERYWERIQRWNRQSDIALMSYLGVDQKFWCVDESIPLQRISRLKDHCYATVVDSLQRLSTMFSPADKLNIIQQTFDEVTKSVQTILGTEYLWNMDDLFPVFQYITVRARIRHLGAEIHLIDDLMEKHLEHGELGIMFTTLKACYFQVLNEKINI